MPLFIILSLVAPRWNLFSHFTWRGNKLQLKYYCWCYQTCWYCPYITEHYYPQLLRFLLLFCSDQYSELFWKSEQKRKSRKIVTLIIWSVDLLEWYSHCVLSFWKIWRLYISKWKKSTMMLFIGFNEENVSQPVILLCHLNDTN